MQMMSTGMPMMYTPNMQRFMPSSAMGMMGVNRPPFIPFPRMALPRPAHMEGLGPPYPPPRYPFPIIQGFDPSRVQQPDPVQNQPQFPGCLNPYSQFVGLQQMQQPPPPHLQVIVSHYPLCLFLCSLQMVHSSQDGVLKCVYRINHHHS